MALYSQEVKAGGSFSSLCPSREKKIKVTVAQSAEIEKRLQTVLLNEELNRSFEERLLKEGLSRHLIYDAVRAIAQFSGGGVTSGKMADFFLAFGTGLSKTKLIFPFMDPFVETAGRFKIKLFERSVPDYLSDLTFVPGDRSVIVDLRFEDRSSVQIYFVSPPLALHNELLRVASIDDIGDQINEFFKVTGDLLVRKVGDHFSYFDSINSIE